MSKDVAQYVDVKFTYHIPKSGIYQIDLIHPYVSDDLTPSYRISLLGGKKEGIIGKKKVCESSRSIQEHGSRKYTKMNRRRVLKKKREKKNKK